MPRYFFHHRIGDHMMWDGIGLDLPDLGLAPASDEATALWTEALTERTQPNRILYQVPLIIIDAPTRAIRWT